MTSKCYLTTGKTPGNAAVPKPSAKISDASGMVTKDWWRYLTAITSPPFPESSVQVGASPTAYTADGNGTMMVSGGTGVSLTIASRANPPTASYAGTTYPVTANLIPMSVGDTLNISYTTTPTLVWFPR